MIAEKVNLKEIIGGRYDNSYVLFHHRLLSYKYPSSPLQKFLISKPQYGANETSISRESNEVPRYIRITDIDENGCLADNFGATAKNVESKYILKNNDILIARSGNTVGKSYIHKTETVNETCFFAGYLIRFVIDTNLILPDYVFIFTKLSVFANWVKVTQRVTGQPNINAKEYSNLPIPVPPIETQQRIIEIYQNAQKARLNKIDEAKQLLNSIDDYIIDVLGIVNTEYNEQSNSFYKQKISSIIGGRFDPPQFHPERTKTIDKIKKGDWCKLQSVIHNVKTTTSSISQNDTYVGLENINGDTGEYVITNEKESVSSAALFKKGNILFPKLRPYLNKVHRAQFDGCCSTEFHVFEAHDIHPDFLTIVLRSNLVLAQTKHLMTGNTLPRLQTTDIENLIIPYPDMDVQVMIVDFVRNIQYKVNLLKEDGNRLIDDAKLKIENIISR